jgi:molybdenum cofactor cytidylyltransferase
MDMDQTSTSGLASDESESLSILLLAAGSSSRLGQSKQLVSINGQSLLCQTVLLSLRVCNQVTVVLGSDFKNHISEISRLPVHIIENREWKKGMGSSLKIGLENTVKKWPATKSLLVLVCDQPLLTSAHLQKLINMADQTNKKIIASGYKSVLGVPVLFKKELFIELRQIGDSEGAKKIIQQHESEIESVEFIGGEIDIDTPADLEKLKDYLLPNA